MSCCKCNLIDFDCLRKYTQFLSNVTQDRLDKHIIFLHENDLIHLIGQECVDILCNNKLNNLLTNIQIELIEKLQPWFALIVEYYYLGHPQRYESVGAIKPVGNDFVEFDGIKLQNYYKLLSELISNYRNKIIDFLVDNAIEFPCYKNYCECSINKQNGNISDIMTYIYKQKVGFSGLY